MDKQKKKVVAAPKKPVAKAVAKPAPKKEKKKGGDDATPEAPTPSSPPKTVQPVKPRPTIFDPISEVIAKYSEHGWQALRAPKGSMNDIVAQKGPRFHFVQVVTPETIDDVKFTGLPKNSFIQNAFSNGATPIFAHVEKVNKKTPEGLKTVAKIVFEDVNMNKGVIVGGKRNVAEDAEKKEK